MLVSVAFGGDINVTPEMVANYLRDQSLAFSPHLLGRFETHLFFAHFGALPVAAAEWHW